LTDGEIGEDEGELIWLWSSDESWARLLKICPKIIV